MAITTISISKNKKRLPKRNRKRQICHILDIITTIENLSKNDKSINGTADTLFKNKNDNSMEPISGTIDTLFKKIQNSKQSTD